MKKIINIVFLCFMLLLFVSCNNSNAEIESEIDETDNTQNRVNEEFDNILDIVELEDSNYVGVVLPSSQEPRWVADEVRFNDIFEARGIKSDIIYSYGNVVTEERNVESLIEKGIDVLIICAVSSTDSIGAVEKAKEAGVSVIAYDRAILNTEAIDYFVTFDSVDVGYKQGEFLVEQANDRKNIPLYIYTGDVEDANSIQVFKGAWEKLQPKIADGTFIIANSNIAEKYKEEKFLEDHEIREIIEDVSTDWDINIAAKNASIDLTNNGDELKGDVFVLAPNDGTARSIYDVFDNDSEINEITITGQDANIESIQSIMDGEQSMTILKDTRILIGSTVDTTVMMSSGKMPKGLEYYNNGAKNILTLKVEIETVTKDNLEDVIFDSGYYSIADFDE